MKTKIKVIPYRNFRIIFDSEVYENEIYDTSVVFEPSRLTDKTMFVIAGNDIDNFIADFDKLITKYRI